MKQFRKLILMNVMTKRYGILNYKAKLVRWTFRIGLNFTNNNCSENFKGNTKEFTDVT